MRRTACFLCFFTLFLGLTASAQNTWATKVDQIYLYIQEGRRDKADKLFNQLLKELPDNDLYLEILP